MNANLNQMITDGTIDLNDLPADATQQEENKFLYDAGVSGIKKIDNPPYI
jgi:hypothetical protein